MSGLCSDFIAGVFLDFGIGGVDDRSGGTAVDVAGNDIVGCGFASDEDAADCTVVGDGDVSTWAAVFVMMVGLNEDGHTAVDADVITLDMQAVDGTGLVERQIGVAAVVDEAAVLDVGVAVVLVHETFAVVDVILVVGGPVAMDFVVIVLDHPAPAAHLHGPCVCCGRTAALLKAPHRLPPHIIREANQVAGADRSVTAEFDGVATGAVDGVVTDDDALAEAPRMAFGCAAWLGTARRADAGVVALQTWAKVVIEPYVKFFRADFLVPGANDVALHQKAIVALNKAVVGQQGVLIGLHRHGGPVPLGESLPPLLPNV